MNKIQKLTFVFLGLALLIAPLSVVHAKKKKGAPIFSVVKQYFTKSVGGEELKSNRFRRNQKVHHLIVINDLKLKGKKARYHSDLELFSPTNQRILFVPNIINGQKNLEDDQTLRLTYSINISSKAKKGVYNAKAHIFDDNAKTKKTVPFSFRVY